MYRSFVWKYFKKEKNHALCNFCNKELTYKGGTTSNLKRHLNAHKSKVPELKNLNVESGVSVLDMLNNKKNVSSKKI